MASVLEAIYEADFMGISYGFRPGRGQHDALNARHAGIYRKSVNWVLDADTMIVLHVVRGRGGNGSVVVVRHVVGIRAT